MISKGVLKHANQDGSLTNAAVKAALGITADPTGSWNLLDGGAPTVSSVTANGNRSYTINFASDYSTTLSPGMRLKTTRTVAAPTQCTSLNGTTQYYSKSSPSGMTFTDDFTVSAWIKVSSYATGIIASRYNGTSGWQFYLNASGQLFLMGLNAGAANTSYVNSYQSVPLNKWVHVSAQLDMSTFTATTTTSYVMIDGVNVPALVTRTGTNPTALIQAGDLQIGAANGAATFFPGKIAQVAIYSAKVTQATILASMNQTLTGSETSLVSAYTFNNSINDLSANANNLTAQGSAVATNADSPFGYQAGGTISSTLDYAIITNIATTAVTVQVPEGCTIPTTGGVAGVSYSTVKTPYGFPGDKSKWNILTIIKTDHNNGASTADVYYNVGSISLAVPSGAFELKANINGQATTAGASTHGFAAAIAATAGNAYEITRGVTGYITNLTGDSRGTVNLSAFVNNSASTNYYINVASLTSNASALYVVGAGVGSDTRFYAENAYL
jgi:hypothetical protein